MKLRFNMAHVFRNISIIFAVLGFACAFAPQLSITSGKRVIYHFYDVLFSYPTYFGFAGYILLLVSAVILILTLFFWKNNQKVNVLLVAIAMLLGLVGTILILNIKVFYSIAYPEATKYNLSLSLGPILGAGSAILSLIVSLFSIYIDLMLNRIKKELK